DGCPADLRIVGGTLARRRQLAPAAAQGRNDQPHDLRRIAVDQYHVRRQGGPAERRGDDVAKLGVWESVELRLGSGAGFFPRGVHPFGKVSIQVERVWLL